MNAASAVLDSTIRGLIDELAAEKAPPIYKLGPEQARNTSLRAQSGPVEEPEVHIKDSPSIRRQARFVCAAFGPSASTTPTSVVMYFHGAAGSWETRSRTTAC